MDILSWIFVLLLTVIGVVVVGYLYATWTHDIFKKMGIPYPEPGLLGLISRYKTEGVGGCDVNLVKKYGRVIGVFHGRIPSIMVSDPNILKHVLVKDFSNFVNRGTSYGPMPKIVADCVSEIKDDHWKFMRCVLSPTFSTGKLKKMMLLIDKCADLLVRNVDDHIKKGKNLELRHLMGCYTMDVIASTGFNIDLDTQSNENNIFISYSKKAMTLTFPIIFLFTLMFPFTKPLFEKIDYKFPSKNPEKEKFHGMVKQVIKDRRNASDTGQRDLLQLMLNAHNDDCKDNDDSDEDTETLLDFKYYKKRGLTDYEIFCNSHIFLLAGYDTTSSGLTFTTYLLATHPEIQDKLRQEIDSKIGNDKPSYTAVMKLQYLDNIIKETLRLYPPATRIMREPARDTTINGYHFPAGIGISIPIYAIHHDPELWPEPEKFDPDRFLPENKSELHDYKWLPFGHGPRNCMGMRLAMLEAKMALVALMQKFIFKVSSDTEIPVQLEKGAFTRPQNPLYIGVERRN